MSDGFSVVVVSDGTGSTLAVCGELDAEHADDLRAIGELTAQSLNGQFMVIDMAGVPFIDSTGVGALVAIRDAAFEFAHDIKLRNVPPRVHKVLDITGLSDAFGLHPRDAAKV